MGGVAPSHDRTKAEGAGRQRKGNFGLPDARLRARRRRSRTGCMEQVETNGLDSASAETVRLAAILAPSIPIQPVRKTGVRKTLRRRAKRATLAEFRAILPFPKRERAARHRNPDLNPAERERARLVGDVAVEPG